MIITGDRVYDDVDWDLRCRRQSEVLRTLQRLGYNADEAADGFSCGCQLERDSHTPLGPIFLSRCDRHGANLGLSRKVVVCQPMPSVAFR